MRRREYYTRRVKADFAPLNPYEKISFDDSSPLSPFQLKLKTRKMVQIKKAKERILKAENEKPEWRTYEPNGEKKYISNSEKSVVRSQRIINSSR